MPTTYTPAEDNNPLTFTLPSDLDPKTAESVNAALRALADKIVYTQVTTPELAAFNDFTRGQRATPPDDAEPVLSTTRVPAADNRWALLFSAPLEVNRHLRMFQGGFSGAGRFIITVNAKWDVTLQEWSRDDNTGEASALIMATDYISFHYVAAGSSPWSTWPTDSGTIGNVRCSGEFRYTEAKTRVRTIPVTSGTGHVGFSDIDGSCAPLILDDHTFIRWPIRLPFGAVLSKVHVIHYCNESASETFRITRRRTTWDPFDVELPTEEVLVEATSGSAVGAHRTTLDVGGVTVDRYDELSIQWEPSALSMNAVHAITVEFLDLGPSPIA
jgi:hypothetical protein